MCTKDSVLSGPDYEELRKILAETKSAGMYITKEGDIEYFLVVNIYKLDSDTYHLSHPQLTNKSLSNLGFE